MTTSASSTPASSGLFHRLIPRDGNAIPFKIDGEDVAAIAGDLLITAILTHRTYVRRFEFGPGMRAGFCMMGACQDCWVQLADGQRVRACTTLVSPGMAVVTGGANE